jgi:hypothetical protein
MARVRDPVGVIMGNEKTTESDIFPEIPPLRSLAINYEVPPNPTSYYATQAVIQSTDNEFLIYFFEVFPPLIYGDEISRREQFLKLESIPARFVARIVMTPERIPGLIAALQQNLAGYEKRLELSEIIEKEGE